MRYRVGFIGVDAGLCWVGDPCYVLGKDAGHGVKTWKEFCDKHDKAVKKSEFGWKACEPLGDGIGFAISTGIGDGEYPVYIETDRDGIVKKIIIDFFGDEEE